MCIGWKMVGWQVAHREQAHSYMIDVHRMENGWLAGRHREQAHSYMIDVHPMENGWLAGAIASRLTPTGLMCI
jgi:hypothetical protein